jgi:hypothetical protein
MSIDDLKTEFQTHKSKAQPFIISPAQIKYLEVLHYKSTLSDQTVFNAIKQILKLDYDITTWSTLTYKQVKYLLDFGLPQLIPDRNGLTLASRRLIETSRVRYKTRDISLESTFDYEWGYQIKEGNNTHNTYKLYYLRYYDMAMLDYDHKSLDWVKSRLQKFPEGLFYIYQTYGGYRVFIVSHRLHYRDQITHQLLELLETDPWYLHFIRHHGFKVRMSPKYGRVEPFIAKFIESFAPDNNAIADEECLELIHEHDKRLNTNHA